MTMCETKTKVCSKCGEEKPLTKEYFKKRKLKSGNISWRGACRKCLNTRHRELHAEKLKSIVIPDEKHCPCCKNILPNTSFNSNRGRVDGLAIYCKNCEAQKRDTDDYREYERERTKKRWKTQEYKEYQAWYKGLEKSKNYIRGYNYKNRDRRNEYERQRHEIKKQDTIYVLTKQMRRIIWKSIKSKTKQTFDIIGCSADELKLYLENQFQEDMSWDNYGIDGWHIDHIIPLSSAETEEEIIRLNHYTNLQPLWAEDNLRKSDKISEEWGNLENTSNTSIR